MQCPVCPGEQLVLAERQGIEIDYCPKCRGVWLDRGELDKIIERAAAQSAPPARDPAPRHPYQRDYGFEERRYDDDDERGGYRRRKRRSFLDDLFDFD